MPDSDIHDSYYVINVLAISFGLAHIRVCRVFSGRSINGGENNRLLFSLLFSKTFCGGQGLDGGRQSCDGGSPSFPSPTRETLV